MDAVGVYIAKRQVSGLLFVCLAPMIAGSLASRFAGPRRNDRMRSSTFYRSHGYASRNAAANPGNAGQLI
jgi:hypothetical protein